MVRWLDSLHLLGDRPLHPDRARRLLDGAYLSGSHRLFASPELIATVERGQLWTEGILNVVPSSVLSLQILTNNIVVSLFAYCAGFLFGLGTLYILGLNGLMLGAVFAFTGQHGLDGALFRFVVAHGCVEISVMCLSGRPGAAVGEALIRPAHGDRVESFQSQPCAPASCSSPAPCCSWARDSSKAISRRARRSRCGPGSRSA